MSASDGIESERQDSIKGCRVLGFRGLWFWVHHAALLHGVDGSDLFCCPAYDDLLRTRVLWFEFLVRLPFVWPM